MLQSKKLIFTVGMSSLVLLALILRISLASYQSIDYQLFLSPWYDHLAQHGFVAFREAFANYNPPYLYILFLLSNFQIENIIAVKSISIAFDFLLAFSIYLVIRQFTKNSFTPIIAGAASLFLPTVLLNGAVWGQCDVIFTSFLLLSFWGVLKKNTYLTWIFWGIALSFKLQAIFFLPFIGYLFLATKPKNIKELLAPLLSVVIFFISLAPALFAGRSIGSLLGTYIQQNGTYQSLTLNAPNFYQWIPNEYFSIFNQAGLVTCMAVTIALILASLMLLNNTNKRSLLALASLFLIVIPLLLPQMHERYFFAAEIFVFVLAFTLPWRFFYIALVLQITAVCSYLPFLFGLPSPIPMSLLPILQLLPIILLIYIVFYRTITKKDLR